MSSSKKSKKTPSNYVSNLILPSVGSPKAINLSARKPNENKSSKQVSIPEMVNDEIDDTPPTNQQKTYKKQPSIKKSGSSPGLLQGNSGLNQDSKTQKLTKLMNIDASPKSEQSVSLDSKTSDQMELELKEDISSGGDSSRIIKSSRAVTDQVKQSIKLFKMVNGAIIEQNEDDSPDGSGVASQKRPYVGPSSHEQPSFKLNIQQTGEGSSISNLSDTDGEDPRNKKVEILLSLTEKSQRENKKDEAESLYNRFNEMDIAQQAIRDQHQEVLKQIPEAEPIYQLSHKYAEGTASPAWRKKQMRHKMMFSKDIVEVNDSSEESMSLSDEEVENLPGDKESQKSQEGEKKRKKNNAIQEKLQRFGEKIKIQSEKAIKTQQYSELFGHQIYDGYRPQNLAQCRDYLEFLINGDIYNEEATPQHILDYMNKDLETDLPEFINQKHILRFDQNFECGNLDSAYIHNCEEYNLILKVDSNTKGNTYWFYFSTEGFRVGVRYTFNIFNFTRSMEKFYREGMNVLTKAENNTNVDEFIKMSCPQSKVPSPTDISPSNSPSTKKESEAEKGGKPAKSGQWRYNTCQNIVFEQSPVARIQLPDRQKQYYQKLSFSYTFQQEDFGKSVHFAYALPYSYTDLLCDLEEAKQNLLQQVQIADPTPSEKVSSPPTFDQKKPPTFKVLKQKDYLDAAKFKHFSHYQNDDYVPIISPLLPPSEADGSTGGADQMNPNRKIKSLRTKNSTQRNLIGKKGDDLINPDNQKVSQFAQQHEMIKRLAKANMYTKTSKFETQFIKDQNEGKGEMKDHIAKDQNQAVMTSKDDEGSHNFEITTDYLHYRQEVIAQSMGGLNIFQLTITKRKDAGSYKHRKKQVIYIQARLHAAETHGSLIMSKIIKELSSNFEKYDTILNRNIIKLVPMINPDGVVLGNSRSSLAGVDLNRRWCNPNATIHPELYFLKMNMKATAQQSAGITIFCDLHGHNKNQNCFIYGCNKAPNEGLLSWTKTRLLPKIIASQEPIFDFNMSKFSQEKTKYNTARVVVWNEFKVTNSFTLETSQYGQQKQTNNQKQSIARKGDIVQLVREDFDSIGLNLLVAFKHFFQLESELEKEFKNTGGWLKKKKLDQVTGVTARQKAENNDLLEKQKRLQMGSERGSVPKKKPMRHQSFAGDKIIPLGQKLNQNKQNSSRNVLNLNAGGMNKLQAAPTKTGNNKKIAGLGDSAYSLEGFEKNRPQSANSKGKKKGDEKKKDSQMPAFLAQFFTKNEMDKAIQDSNKPIEKSPRNKAKKQSKKEQVFESDSEPSCDNYEEAEMKEIFNEALSEGDIEEQFPKAVSPPQVENLDTLKVVPEESEPLLEEEKQVFDIANQINSIEDYQVIADQLKAAKAESRQLTEKFEKLSRQINKKMSVERRAAPQITIQTPMPFRGGWNDMPANQSQTRPISIPSEIVNNQDKKRQDILSAGPKSGEAQSATRIPEIIQQQSNQQPGSLFPAVQMNDQRRVIGGMATSAARANKYRARNSILNVSQFNMENGLTQVSKTPVRPPQSHVHPEYNSQRFNIAQRSNRPSQVQGMIIGQSMQMNSTQQQPIGNSTSPNVHHPKELKQYNTTAKKRQILDSGSKRQTMFLEQPDPLVQEQPPLSTQQSLQSQIGNVTNFNQAIKNELLNRSNFQESMKQNYNSQKKSPNNSKRPLIIDERQFKMDQQFHNNQITAAIDQNKMNFKRQEIQTSPQQSQQLNISADMIPPIKQNHSFINSGGFETQNNQTEYDQIVSPIIRIRGSKNSKPRIIVDSTDTRQSQSRRVEQDEFIKQSSNFFQMAMVSQNPKVTIKPSQIRRKGAHDAYEKPSSGSVSQGYCATGEMYTLSPKSKDHQGTQSAQINEQRMENSSFIATASGKYAIRNDWGQQQFEQGANILRNYNAQESNPNMKDSDYFSESKQQFKRKARKKIDTTFTPVHQSGISKKFFESDPSQNSARRQNESFSQTSYIPDNIRYGQQFSSPKMNQRTVGKQSHKLQQSIVNYEDPSQTSFQQKQQRINNRQGRNSQSITPSSIITPQKQKDDQLILQIINRDAQRLQTEEDYSQKYLIDSHKQSPMQKINNSRSKGKTILSQLMQPNK